MDQKEYHYNYVMSNLMQNQYSYPYFASKENQTLYIIIPTPNPMIFNQVDENLGKIEICSTEEEILPDFRCKICSATIFNYPDFKIHLQNHQKAVEGILKTSFLGNDRSQGWKNENSISKSGPSDNIENRAITGNPNCGSNLDTTKKSANLMPKNEALLSKIISNPLLEEYKRQFSSNKLFDTSNSPITPLNNFKISKSSKLGEALEIQNQKCDTKNVVKFPLIKTVDKLGGYMPTNKLSNDMYEILSSAKDSFEKSVSDVEIINSPLINQLHLFKEPVPTYDKNINIPVMKPDSAFSSFQSQLAKPNKMTSTKLEDIYLHRSITDSSSEKGIDQSIDKFNDSVFKNQMPGECNSDISTYSKNKMTTEGNVREKAMECAKRMTSSCPLKSTDVCEHDMSSLKSLSNIDEKNIRCLHCGKIFESRFSMTKHLIELQETKILYCVLCKSSFTCISSLRKHLLMFHCDAKDRRQCSHCDYRCFQTSDLQKHIARRHTRDFKYKCLYCIKGFATPKELRNHLARNHL